MGYNGNLISLIQNVLANDKKAVVSTSYADDYTVQGKHFLATKRITIGTGASVYILIDMAAAAASGKNVYFNPMAISTSEETVEFTIYIDSNYTGGTAIAANNLNFTAAAIAETTIKQGATGTTKGNNKIEGAAFASSGFLTSGPGEAKSIGFIADTSKKILVEIENKGTGDTTIVFNQSFFEI